MSNIDFAQVETKEMAENTNRQRLLELLAEMRWRKECSGVSITKDAVFQSDRTTRTDLASLITNLKLGTIEAPVTWKAISGWEVLGEDQLRQLLWLVNEHVQACFRAERLVSARIEAGEIVDAHDLVHTFEAAFNDIRNETGV